MATMMRLDDLQRSSWEVAESKGFHQAQVAMDPETLAVYLRLLLCIGELCEAAEELRAGFTPAQVYYEHTLPDGRVIQSDQAELWHEGLKNTVGKPAGFGIELADALIRLCDLAEGAGVSLSAACEVKEAYNKTRAFLHGKTA